MTPEQAIDVLVSVARPESLADLVSPVDLTTALDVIRKAQRIQRERIGPFGMLAAECERRAAILYGERGFLAAAEEVADLGKWCSERAAEERET